MIDLIKHIDGLLDAGLSHNEFAVTHSAWLALMGMRRNGDLDLLISSTLRNELFPDADPNKSIGLPGPYERRIRFHPQNSLYGTFYGAKGVDDVIANYTVIIDGLRFVEPRFYFMYKKQRMRKLVDQKNATPSWKRSFGLPLGVNKILNRKISKDQKDFDWIEQYLIDERHKQGGLSHIPDTAWGIPECDWLPNR